MKIYLKIFKDKNFGNYKTEIILITTNKIKVSDLKQIIFQKFGIEKSMQRLITKLYNKKLAILADEFPLFCFKIKEKSIIFVEILEKMEKNKEDIFLKVKQREVKSKYLRHLNIFRNRPNMDIIQESSIEDMDDSQFRRFTLINQTTLNINNIEEENNINNYDNNKDFNKTREKRFINSLINNNLDEFKDIIKHYNEFIDINKPIGKNKKYSIIHYVSKFDNSSMMEELINKYNADVNLVSLDGWAPLHISAYKGNLKMINILINYKKTNFDLILPKIGTALHCACINNNFKVVALLLHKCNPNIKNDDGLLPIDLTIDINIKKLISKTLNIFCDFEDNINDVSINRKIKSDGGIGERLTKSQLLEFQFLKDLSFIPPNPARFTGYVYKKGKRFSHYNLRYIEINAVKDLFLRFFTKDDYPGKPKEVLSLRKIIHCRKKKTSEEGKYYMEIIFKDSTHIYRFDSLKTCNTWIEEINKSIEYIKFWIKYEQKYSDIQAFLCTIKQDLYEIDYITGEVKTLEIKKESNKKLKPIIIDNKEQNKNNKNKNKDKNLLILENSLLNNSSVDINSFDILETIFKGNFGIIYKVKFKLTGEIFSMKALNKKNIIKNNKLKFVMDECNIFTQFVSPFVLTLYYTFQTYKYIYLIYDYCPGGDLNFHILHELFEEDEAKFYIAEIILAIEYLHKIDMIFENFNFENILISDDNHIKLGDFECYKLGNNYNYDLEFSDNRENNKNTNNKIKRGKGKSSDMYGIGAMLYEMICGSAPFYSSNFKSNIKNKENELIFHDYFSGELKDLLSKLLNKDPNKRIGLSSKVELKNHPWFKDIDWDKLSRKGINPPLNLVKMKKEIEENYNYITNEEKEENIIDNNTDVDENILPKEIKLSIKKPNNFTFNRKDNENYFKIFIE